MSQQSGWEPDNPTYPTSVTTAKGPGLGLISLAAVAGMAALSFFGAWQVVSAINRGMAVVGSEFSGTINLGPAVTGPLGTIATAAFFGLAAWITALGAAASNRGRLPAKIAIVFGVLSPIIVVAYIWAGVAETLGSFTP